MVYTYPCLIRVNGPSSDQINERRKNLSTAPQSLDHRTIAELSIALMFFNEGSIGNLNLEELKARMEKNVARIPIEEVSASLQKLSS